jgi:hypothetical protein
VTALTQAEHTPANPEEVRPLPSFVPSVVRQQVERDLGALHDGEKLALIAGLDRTAGHLALVVRLPDGHWSFSGYLDKPWKGPAEVGAKIVFAI